MDFLRAYRGALLVISHDLDLLDEAITRVLHLDRADEKAIGHIVEYKGTYSQYLAARADDEVRLAKLAERQAKEIDRMQRSSTASGPRRRRPRWPTAWRSASPASRPRRSTSRAAPRCSRSASHRRRRRAGRCSRSPG